MTPKTTAKKAEPDTSTVQTTEVKEAPAKTTVRKTRTTAKKTTEKTTAEKSCTGISSLTLNPLASPWLRPMRHGRISATIWPKTAN